MKQIKTNSSEVIIGEDVFARVKKVLKKYETHKKFLFVDENSFLHCATEFIMQTGLTNDIEIIEIESGEENKTIEICLHIWQTFLDFNADRKTLLINLGGGVITDMGGFIASTYKRGIDFINIPTTLLAQIDASVGGKVAIDLNHFKNAIGVFNEPQLVVIYPPFLKTLNKRQMLSGYAEALKHGLIANLDYWKKLKTGMLSDANQWQTLIETSVEIKNTIVLSDFEEKGERKKLNFGHTVGHAIESHSLKHDKNPLLHGEAVAIGIICESYLSHLELELSAKALKDISTTVLTYFNPYPIKESFFNHYIELMKNDKKNEKDTINFTLLSQIGIASVNHSVSEKNILEALNYYISITK